MCLSEASLPQVSAPPSAGDIFSEDQLVEKLASLIANHPLTSRWLFKLPDHVGGKGFGEPAVIACRQGTMELFL